MKDVLCINRRKAEKLLLELLFDDEDRMIWDYGTEDETFYGTTHFLFQCPDQLFFLDGCRFFNHVDLHDLTDPKQIKSELNFVGVTKLKDQDKYVSVFMFWTKDMKKIYVRSKYIDFYNMDFCRFWYSVKNRTVIITSEHENDIIGLVSPIKSAEGVEF